MIRQISDVKTKTESLGNIEKGSTRIGRIKAQLKERLASNSLPSHVDAWSPLTVGSHLLPVSRWVE